MIKVNNINGSPEITPANYVARHSDGNFFYFFETMEEWGEFFAAMPNIWNKESHCAEIEAAVDAMVDEKLKLFWYRSLGDVAATAVNGLSRWQSEAIALNTWQGSCYEELEDYKTSVTEQTALSVNNFLASLPALNNG